MGFRYKILISEIFIFILVYGFVDEQLIKEYFKNKMTNYGVIIGCFTEQEKFKTAKFLTTEKRYLSILDITEPNNLEFLETTHKHYSVLDGDCDSNITKNFLQQCGLNRLFGAKHHWLILTKNSNFSKLLNGVELYINADIYLLHVEKRNFTNKYILNDIYNPSFPNGGSLKTMLIGYNDSKNVSLFPVDQNKYIIRRNMSEVTLKTIIVLPMPFDGTLSDYLKSDKNPHINTFNRFHYSLLRPCVDYYNFTPNITLSKSWGYLTTDGTFDGLVGALQRKQVDYGSSPLFVRSDRAEVMEYGRRTWTLRAAFVFRNPPSLRSVDIFIKPLSYSIWISLVFTSSTVLIILKYTQILEKIKLDKKTDVTWSYLIICTISIFAQQGMTSLPRSFSGRITMLFMLVMSYMIYQFYSASIVSNLLIKPKKHIKSVEDILKSNMKAGCEDILYNRDYFLYTTDKSSRELYFKKIKEVNNSNFLPPPEGLELVKQGGYAFHVELATAYPIIGNTFPEKSICELSEVQMYRTQPMHANLQKYSPFRDMFDTCLQRLAEYGVLYREINYWHPKQPVCLETKDLVKSYLGLEYFYPVFGFLFLGTLISVIILNVELYLSFRGRIRKKENIGPFYPYVD